MRTITNDHRDAQILDLGSGYEKGPFLVTQMGVAPNDAVPKTKMFVLRPDGKWVDFNAYACKGKPEAMDELVLIFFLAFAFPGNAEDAIFDCYPNVILLHLRQISFEQVLVIILTNINL